jgi:hypothetical protein
MGKLDLALLLGFGSLALITFAGSILCFRKALKVSNERDGDLKMFFWAAGTLLGLIIAGASAGYILFPIVFHD